ncbi:MAG: oligosaccharide flippase family protein, partial [Bacteroidota bacterium]
MKYAKGVLITLLAKGFAIPVGVASSIITARYLGPEGRGVLAVLFVLQGAAVLFGSLGLHSSSTYFIARNKENASAIASNILSAALGLSLLTAGVLYAIGHIKPEALIGKVDVVYLNIFLIVVPFTYIAQFFQGMFLAYQKIYELNLLELFPRFLQMLLFAVVLMLLGLGTFEAVLCFVGAAVAGGVVYLLRARRLVPFT